MHIFVDSIHAGDKCTQHSYSDFLIYVNTVLFDWYLKHQAMIETGDFGPEFIAIKTTVDTFRGLRYKLRMIGVAMHGTHKWGQHLHQQEARVYPK